jgi:hypothetical protein
VRRTRRNVNRQAYEALRDPSRVVMGRLFQCSRLTLSARLPRLFQCGRLTHHHPFRFPRNYLAKENSLRKNRQDWQQVREKIANPGNTRERWRTCDRTRGGITELALMTARRCPNGLLNCAARRRRGGSVPAPPPSRPRAVAVIAAPSGQLGCTRDRSSRAFPGCRPRS